MFSSSRTQNLDVWVRSIIRRSIGFYFYSISLYWRGLDLHLMIRLTHPQCWHEKCSLNRVSTSYKLKKNNNNNPATFKIKSTVFHLLHTYFPGIEFKIRAFSGQRKMHLSYRCLPPAQCRLTLHLPALHHTTKRKGLNLWLPQIWALGDSRAEDQVGLFCWQFSLLPHSPVPLLNEGIWDIIKNSLFNGVRVCFHKKLIIRKLIPVASLSSELQKLCTY